MDTTHDGLTHNRAHDIKIGVGAPATPDELAQLEAARSSLFVGTNTQRAAFLKSLRHGLALDSRGWPRKVHLSISYRPARSSSSGRAPRSRSRPTRSSSRGSPRIASADDGDPEHDVARHGGRFSVLGVGS